MRKDFGVKEIDFPKHLRGTLYGLPKLHKPGVPFRPIFFFIGSYNHNCARWLSQSLSNLWQHPTNIKDSFDFLNTLSNQNIGSETTVSFDVKSLFTNIATTFTTNFILDSIFTDRSSNWNGLNRNRLKKLLNWTTQNITFQFDNKSDGLAMGSPIGPLMANVLMNYVIDKAITPLVHRPNFFCRFFDALLSLFQTYPPLIFSSKT